MYDHLIETKNLKKYFETPLGKLHAVDDVNISIKAGQTLGVVGESGCGKSTLGRLLIKLLKPTSGQILYQNENISNYNGEQMKKFRKEVQLIFQDPYASLNPRMSVRDIIVEPLIVNKIIKDKDLLNKKLDELTALVGISKRLLNKYPHELDGGRRQRIGIARALSMEPKFIICDEPVSALDVSIQAQILNLLMDLQEELNLTYMFITHDLSVVKHISDEIVVMYLGQIVERASKNELFANTLHPYTKALMNSIPLPDIGQKLKEENVLRGEVTSPINPLPGCRFAARCEYVNESCINQETQLRKVNDEHYVVCNLDLDSNR